MMTIESHLEVNEPTVSGMRTGYIFRDRHTPTAVQYSVVGDLAIFEGDICLGTVNEVDKRTSSIIQSGPWASAVVIEGDERRWRKSIVPFKIEGDGLIERVTQAIKHWEDNTDVRFVEINGGNSDRFPDYISFKVAGGCFSHVGRKGGEQVIGLSSRCSIGNAIHEIGHAIGLWHEQSREDRDAVIRILWDKILEKYRHNFDQHITDGDDIGGYDLGSIMQYPLRAFSVDGTPTIKVIGEIPVGVIVGQRNGLSDGDLTAIEELYDIPDKVLSLKRGSLKREWVPGGSSHTWEAKFSASVHVDWSSIPVKPIPEGGARISTDIVVSRGFGNKVTYLVTVSNRSSEPVMVRVRYILIREIES